MLTRVGVATLASIVLSMPSAWAISSPTAIAHVASCQKRIASAGARFAQQVIRDTLKCTNEISECQVQCDYGVFGPPCDSNPPPCCDPDDPNSEPGFSACMAEANQTCAEMDVKIADQEAKKQDKITTACSVLTQDELCGAQGEGLNFATLNAGCLALNPGYHCDLPSLVQCVGGPLERQLVDQISAVLDARAGDAVAALNLQAVFPGIPIARKVKGQVAPDKYDVWSFSGQAGDDVKVRVVTRDDNGNQTSNLAPVVTLLNASSVSVADTTVRNVACPVPDTCGATCPTFERSLPFTGTFYLAIQASTATGCTGGKYRLIVVSPGGGIPVLVGDDVDTP